MQFIKEAISLPDFITNMLRVMCRNTLTNEIVMYITSVFIVILLFISYCVNLKQSYFFLKRKPNIMRTFYANRLIFNISLRKTYTKSLFCAEILLSLHSKKKILCHTHTNIHTLQLQPTV